MLQKAVELGVVDSVPIAQSAATLKYPFLENSLELADLLLAQTVLQIFWLKHNISYRRSKTTNHS